MQPLYTHVENTWQAIRVPLISLFILFHTFALLLWTSPPFPLYWSIVPLIRPYVCYFGFWNQWKMFSHPKNWTLYLTANVTLQDGQILKWDFPRMENLPYMTRAQKERYREWAHEYVNQNEYKTICPEASRFIARNIQNANAQPVSVQLVRHWTWIQPPPGLGEPLPSGEFEYAFFTYNVRPEDLR
ncbi:MAG: hypothetical protein K2W82_19790 [Candidatus Obscuribacterales bacterium]|nr:hypothetical protein [Candidatus Obscuribacterales bacterium]